MRFLNLGSFVVFLGSYLRIAKYLKISKKYLEWELLKRGVVSQKYKQKYLAEQPANQRKQLEDMKPENVHVNNLFSDNDKRNVIMNTTRERIGRNVNVNYGTTRFIEDYLGTDLINKQTFKKTDKETAFYKEVSSLRDRFPKELFIANGKTPEVYEKEIRETNLKYINELKSLPSKKSTESLESQVIEEFSLTNPINQLTQAIEKERTSFMNYEDNQDSLTLQRFYDKGLNRETINRVHNEDKVYDQSIRAVKLKELERERVRLLRENPPEKYNYPINTIEETYAEYLARKRENKKKMLASLEEKAKAEGKATQAEPEVPVGKKSQFNPSDLTIENIKNLTAKSK